MLTTQKILDLITTEQVIELCCHLQGSDHVGRDSNGNPIFSTVLDHPETSSGSYKLYYYISSKRFYCFTSSQQYDLFGLVKRALGLSSFKEAYQFILKYFNLGNDYDIEFGFDDDDDNIIIDSSTALEMFDLYAKEIIQDKAVDDTILNIYPNVGVPSEWIKEGISPEVMKFYGIRVDAANEKIIIPHRNSEKKLVGIRGRSFNQYCIDHGMKYMPVTIQGVLYNHKLGNHLYGWYQNKKYASEIKTVLLVEAEKSVMQMSSFYSLDTCYAAATCGFNVSGKQIDLLLNSGITDVIFGYDRDFEGGRNSEDTKEYEKRLFRVAKNLLPYFNVYAIIDYDHILPHKASVTDCGKEIYETLLAKKIKLTEAMCCKEEF